jgi:hypothetical protein
MSKGSTIDKMMKKTRDILVCVLVCVLLGASPALADNSIIPFDLQAKLFLTALTYDKNLEKRGGDELTIGLLYFPEVSQSKEYTLQFSQALKEFKDKKVRGLGIITVLLSYTTTDALTSDISRHNIDILYIGTGTKNLVKEITGVTQSKGVLSFASTATYVTDCGVSLAVGLKGGRPKLYLNLPSSKKEGADFGAKLLRVADVVERFNAE